MRQDTRSAWADPTLTLPAPKRRSRTFNVVLGVLLTIVAAGIADAVSYTHLTLPTSDLV